MGIWWLTSNYAILGQSNVSFFVRRVVPQTRSKSAFFFKDQGCLHPKIVKIWWILLMFWCLVSEFSMVFRVPVQKLLRLYQPTWGDLSNFTWLVQKGVNVSKKCGLKGDERGHIFGFWPTKMGIAATNMGRSDNVTNTWGLARWMAAPRNIIFHLVKTTAGKSAKTRRILVASPIPDEGNQEHPRKFESKNHFWSSCRGFSSNIWVCLKIGYTPNYSHLVGIMIINHWV